MQWGEVKDRIVEGRRGKTRCWILMNPKGKVHAIYIKIDEVSKFLPEDEYEETLEGAKLRAEIELERYDSIGERPKPAIQTRV
jgi:hypothetical protein